MSAKSEAADAAAKVVAKGALHLINWGKKLIPATDDEIAKFGPNAANVKAVLGMIGNVSDDAARLSSKSMNGGQRRLIADAGDDAYDAVHDARRTIQDENVQDFVQKAYKNYIGKPLSSNARFQSFPTFLYASKGEMVSDLITPQSYRTLTNPLAVARRFDRTVPNAPESFTNIARSLGERSLVATPKDIELARRVSMLPPAMQQVYLDLVGEGTDPAQLLQALRLMGQ